MEPGVEYCEFDDAWIERGSLIVRGRAPNRQGTRLVARRYKSRPDWAVVEVVAGAADPAGADVTDATDATHSADDEYRLSCAIDGLTGNRGICVMGHGHRRLVPCPDTATPATTDTAT